MWISSNPETHEYIWVAGDVPPAWTLDGTPPEDAVRMIHVGYGKFRAENGQLYIEVNKTELQEVRRAARGSTFTPRPFQKKKDKKSFNMRGRAVAPPEGAVVYTTSDVVAVLAERAGVENIELHTSLPVDLSGFIKEMTEKGMLARLIEADCLYFHPVTHETPLALRAPHAKSRAKPGSLKKVAAAIQPLPGFDVLYTITGPVKKVGKRKGTKSVMGESAHPVMIEARGRQEAFNRHEWLHLIGHALGGADAMFNLGAGSFDANTWMIPLESAINEMSRFCTPEAPGWVRVRGEFEEASPVLRWLELSAGASNGWERMVYVDALSNLALDTFMYDYETMKKKYDFGPQPQSGFGAGPATPALGDVTRLGATGIPRRAEVAPAKSWLAAFKPEVPPPLFSNPPPVATGDGGDSGEGTSTPAYPPGFSPGVYPEDRHSAGGKILGLAERRNKRKGMQKGTGAPSTFGAGAASGIGPSDESLRREQAKLRLEEKKKRRRKKESKFPDPPG